MVQVKVRSGSEVKDIRRQSLPEVGDWILLRGRWWHVIGTSWLI